jgi:hypothetical protein
VPTIEEHISPDGRLRLRVEASPDGDLAIGFDGYAWHTHADILAALSGLKEVDAVRTFVNDILKDKAVIALWSIAGELRDVWVSDEPSKAAAYPQGGEVIELRYWSGRAWVES